MGREDFFGNGKTSLLICRLVTLVLLAWSDLPDQINAFPVEGVRARTSA